MLQEEVLQIIMTKLLRIIQTFLTPKRAENSTHVFINIHSNFKRKRNELQAFFSRKRNSSDDLLSSGVEKTKAYYQESNDADFVNTDKLLDQVISLPMHTELEEKTIEVYYDSVLEFMK